MADDYHTQAERDFYRAKTKALTSRIFGILRPSLFELMPFDEAKRLIKPQGEMYRGVTSVRLADIVGSEGRYRDFNRFFFPKKEHLKSRWTGIDELQYKDVILPPVVLYEMGGLYFVRDGNHRVSVARAKGQEFIDAEVVSLKSEIQLAPDMSIQDIKRAVVEYEKQRFYRETNYVNVVGSDDLVFSEPGRYDTIKEHVLVHKYFLNQNMAEEIPFHEALFSWHENVYQPICQAIEAENLLSLFPGRTVSDLYLFLVAHWDELKRTFGRFVEIGEAAESFKIQTKRGRRRFFYHIRTLWDTICKKNKNFHPKL
jgi:hypothetical protein